MVLPQVGTGSPTARNASDHTIRGAELISRQTAAAIHALDRRKTVTFKTAFYSLDLEQANAGDLAAKASKARALM